MKVTIVGIGWLGKQMADFFLKNRIDVFGTTTSTEKAKQFISKGINAISYDLKSAQLNPELMREVAQSDWIIFTVPPSKFGSTYAAHCIRFFELLQTYAVEGTIIYTSSTSVYGNEERRVDETSETAAHTENAEQIIKVENFLNTHFDRRSIWRMGGLIGPNRHPVNYLAGRTQISKPQAPVNLVHSEDVIQVLQHYIEKGWSYPLLNLCSPEHPTKKEYYTKVAENLNKSLPKFDEQDQRKDKLVHSTNLNEAAFSFKYSSPYDYPQSKNE
jgi:nucleoside-diphosphate-sugar epimerase